MKHTIRQLLGLLLAASILFGVATPVFAQDAGTLLDYGSDGMSNPLYPETVALAAENEIIAEAMLAPNIAGKTFVTIAEAEEQLRDHMINRDSTFTLYISSSSGMPDIKNVLMPAAYSESLAKGVNAGDYLRWSWTRSNWTYYVYNGGHYVFEFTMGYYTTAAQEQRFLRDLAAVMEALDLSRLSDYMKICKIYDYIADHVDYDFDGLDQGKTIIYSAYSALEDGLAVCQGYAALLYAMCRSAGIPVRIITGASHAWNIVAIKGLYYNMDVTWDGQYEESYRNNFLKGQDTFSGHAASGEYRTASFYAAYPMSQTDYVPTAQDEQLVTPFRDVPAQSYYYSAIQNVVNRGLFRGTGTNTFSPEGTMNRAMLVTVLWRMAGSPNYGTASGFTDVSAGDYFAGAVTWAKAKGIANGVTVTKFGPTQTLTREQTATFLYRYAEVMGYSVSANNNLSSYQDVASAGSYAIPCLRWAVGAGIISGTTSTTLNPRGYALRGQMAVMMDRFLKYYKI